MAMKSQLQSYIESLGPQITVGRHQFTVDGISGEPDRAVATFRGPRANYTGVTSINGRVAGRPGAEVWSIVGSRRTMARFAIHQGELVHLA